MRWIRTIVKAPQEVILDVFFEVGESIWVTFGYSLDELPFHLQCLLHATVAGLGVEGTVEETL